MNFIRTFQENMGISERAMAFSPQLPQSVGNNGYGEYEFSYQPAVETLDNGDIVMRYAGEGVRSVRAIIANVGEIEFADQGNGLFEGLLPYDQANAGPRSVTFIVNGIETLSPYVPIWFTQDRTANYIEVPDEEVAEMISIHEGVPRGTVSQEVFFSKAAGRYARCFVYTPAGYEKGGEYPCLYLQHGATENEVCWIYNGKLGYILDNLNAQQKTVPFVVVMNDGMIMAADEPARDSFTAIEAIITEECRSYIESRYRVKKDKWSRALAGLSRGSVQTSVIGMTHPDLYGYLGLFSGFMRRISESDHEKNKHLDAVRDPEQFVKDFRVFFRSIGDCENETQLGRFMEDDAYLKHVGLFDSPVHTRITYPGMRHEWACWRRAIIDFAQLLFRE